MARYIGVILLTTLVLWTGEARGEEAAWGTWTDREGKVTYAFLENNEFQYRSGTGEKTVRKEGVWSTVSGICWLGEKGGGSTGNLMIYVDTHQCCLLAQWLGKNLVLSKIWVKPLWEDFCANRVLIRTKPSVR